MTTEERADASARGEKRRKSTPSAAAPIDRLPPHSIECEQCVLGCILLSPDCVQQCLERLTSAAETFYDLRHQTIFNAIAGMADLQLPIDTVTLQQWLKDEGQLEQVGGIAYLMSLQDMVPSAANLETYLDTVIEKFRLRKIVHACTEMIQRVYDHNGDIDSLMDAVEKQVLSAPRSAVSPTLDGHNSGLRMVGDLERRHQLQGKLSGLDTGFYDLNSMTEGLQYGEQAIIGARPSQGKTALGLCIFEHAIFNGVPAMFISLEMSVEALMRRMLSMHMKIPLRDVRRGSYDDAAFKKFAIFQAQIKSKPMQIVDGVGGIGIREISSRIRKASLKDGIKLVVIDYIQKIKPSEKKEKRTYEVGEVSERLKAVAEETKVAMVTLAQLNRENTKDKGRPPRLSDLADSGQIERDADLVGLIHRNGWDAKLIIAKQRDGETGIVNLVFDGTYCRFENESRQS